MIYICINRALFLTKLLSSLVNMKWLYRKFIARKWSVTFQRTFRSELLPFWLIHSVQHNVHWTPYSHSATLTTIASYNAPDGSRHAINSTKQQDRITSPPKYHVVQSKGQSAAIQTPIGHEFCLGRRYTRDAERIRGTRGKLRAGTWGLSLKNTGHRNTRDDPSVA